MNINFGYLQWYATNIYNGVNGKINPLIPAMSMQFVTTKNKNDLGQSIGNIVLINLPNIINFCEVKNLTSLDSIKGLVMNAVIHELSHLQQDIDYKRYTNEEDYKSIIEFSNDAYTLSYISLYYDTLASYFGSFNMDCVFELPYKNDNVDKYYKLYTPIKNKQDKILALMQSCMQDNIHDVIKYDRIKNISIHFVSKENKIKTIKVLVNNMWSNVDNNIFDLSKMIITGSSYSINVERSNNTLNLIIEECKKEKITPVQFSYRDA